MKRQKPVPPEVPRSDLCDQYGKIGISAVAAAILYQGDVKIPEQTSAQEQVDQTDEDNATWSSAA
jgi:hypothetical protein